MAAEDDAEGGPAGVGEDPEASFAFTWGMGGAQGRQFVLGPVGVAHADAQVHLLLILGTFTGPAGTFRLTAVLTKTQRDLLAKLKIAHPKKVIEAAPARP